MKIALLALGIAALGCGSEEFESKPASNDDSGSGGSNTGGSGGGSIADAGWTDGSVISCDLDAGALNSEGCACSLQGEVKGCYLGKPGPQSACTQGSQMCESGKWGVCAGASAPSDEQCGDNVDNDCDGAVDEGCFCTASTDLCKDGNGNTLPSGDNVFADKDLVSIGDTLDIYVVSTSSLGEVAHSVSSKSTSFYCGGKTNVGECSVGDGCDGWHGAVIAMPIDSPPFHSGEPATITVYIDDPDGPCDGTRIKKLSVDVQ